MKGVAEKSDFIVEKPGKSMEASISSGLIRKQTNTYRQTLPLPGD